MRTRLTIFSILFLTLGLQSSGFAAGIESNTRQAALRTELAQVQARYARESGRRDSLDARSARLASEIADLKARLSGSYSRIDEFRLKERLRASQVLADSLDQLNLELIDIAGKANILREQAIGLYTAAIDSLSLVLESKAPRDEKEGILRRIESLRRERAGLSQAGEGAQSKGREVLPLSLARLEEAVRIGPQDSPEEIKDKADFIADMAGKYSSAISTLEKNLGRLTRESAVRKRLNEFTQEISLFDEGGLSSKAGTRQPAAGPSPGETVVANEGRTFTPLGKSAELEGEKLTTINLELLNPEGDIWLIKNMEYLSPADIEAAVKHLETRRDSLKIDLEHLRNLEKILRAKTRESERKKEDPPRQ